MLLLPPALCPATVYPSSPPSADSFRGIAAVVIPTPAGRLRGTVDRRSTTGTLLRHSERQE